MSSKTAPQKIIEMFGSRRELASDLSEVIGKPVDIYVIHKWHRRSSIPAIYDAALVEVAKKRNVSLTAVDLMRSRAKHADQHGHDKPAFQEAVE